MGGSKPKEPEYKNTYLYQGNDLVQSSELDANGNVVTKMIPTAEEAANKARRDKNITSIENEMETFKPQLNTLSPEFQSAIDKQGKDLLKASQDNFNESFNPAMQALREEAAKKFGTLNSSFFNDEQSKLANIGADTLSQIAQDVEQRKTDLKQTELSNRQNYWNDLGKQLATLQQGINQFYDTENNRYTQAVQAQDMANSWSMDKYKAQLQDYQAAQARRQSMMSGLLGGLF